MKSMTVKLQRPLQAALALDLHDGVGVSHGLYETHTVADGQAAVGQHSSPKQSGEMKQINKASQRKERRDMYRTKSCTWRTQNSAGGHWMVFRT